MSFEIAKEVESYANAVIKVFRETFEHLEEGNLGYLLTDEELKTAGKYIAGFACIPQVQSKQRNIYTWAVELAFGFMPDALVVIQEDTWKEYPEESKVALIYHELRHVIHEHSQSGKPKYTTDGQPVYGIVGHDVEEFQDVTEIFGAWDLGLACMKSALNLKKRDEKRIKAVLKEVKKSEKGRK